MFRTIRDERTTDPLRVLGTTVESIGSLRGDTFDSLTEARHGRATWEQIGDALHERSDVVCDGYSAMAESLMSHGPDRADRDRVRGAL
ncbi:hypothetical protein [Pseudonocardia spirodelae]|uniref:Uncharacterized protein n=1 Tax=Pseudonocardia spirodelae TaxID=3133431 RepID=A0ABU8TCP2_9PSEU